MRPFQPRNHVTLPGLALLVLGSLAIGLVAGPVAYLISTLLYLPILFPVVIGGLASILLALVALRAKIRHGLIVGAAGVLAGLTLALAFYATPYVVAKVELINYAKGEGLSAAEASTRLDSFLTDKTGSAGFLGFMKLRSQEGEDHSMYLFSSGSVVPFMSYQLQPPWTWVSWALEAALFAGVMAYAGTIFGRGEFNVAANDWYGAVERFGAIPPEREDEVVSLMNSGEHARVAALVVPKDTLSDPVVGAYRQRSRNGAGDVILILKGGRVDSASRVTHVELGQWELDQEEAAAFDETRLLQGEAG